MRILIHDPARRTATGPHYGSGTSEALAGMSGQFIRMVRPLGLYTEMR
jgi:hypothetical protein